MAWGRAGWQPAQLLHSLHSSVPKHASIDCIPQIRATSLSALSLLGTAACKLALSKRTRSVRHISTRDY